MTDYLVAWFLSEGESESINELFNIVPIVKGRRSKTWKCANSFGTQSFNFSSHTIQLKLCFELFYLERTAEGVDYVVLNSILKIDF